MPCATPDRQGLTPDDALDDGDDLPLDFLGGGDVIPGIVRLIVSEGADEYQCDSVNVYRPEPVMERAQPDKPDALAPPYSFHTPGAH